MKTQMSKSNTKTKQVIFLKNYLGDEAKEAEPLDGSFQVSPDAEKAIIISANCNVLASRELSLVMRVFYYYSNSGQ
jgi:hypothetical protein